LYFLFATISPSSTLARENAFARSCHQNIARTSVCKNYRSKGGVRDWEKKFTTVFRVLSMQSQISITEIRVFNFVFCTSIKSFSFKKIFEPRLWLACISASAMKKNMMADRILREISGFRLGVVKGRDLRSSGMLRSVGW
jgi:hypothetical protein